MENDITLIFEKLNDNHINYFLLRDYNTMEDILHSKDIDIYIDKKDFKKASKIFKKYDWNNSIFNNSKYAHKQYLKMGIEHMQMFDVVYKLNYGTENYQYFNYASRKTFNNISIPREDVAIITMVLHILFDKGNVSEKNKRILSNMYEDYMKVNIPLNDTILNITKEIISNDIEDSNKKIVSYKKDVLNLNIVKKSHNIFINPYIKIRNIFSKIDRRLSKKSIAFIGMDGSGKSSTIEHIKDIYGDKAIIVYMGNKDFKSKKLEKLIYNNNNSFIGKIEKRILLFKEMYSRYMKYRFSGKVVLFDRYLDDIIIFSNVGKLDKILYNYLFPSPKVKIYLYCDTIDTYKRKDDIEDKELFEKMKNKYDRYYLDKKDVYKIDTSSLSVDETYKVIADIINNHNKTSIY